MNSKEIDDLLTSVDLVKVIGDVVTLKKGESDFYGLCPFHSEKTASFSVSSKKQFYYCFGCGASGNAILFVMKIFDIPFEKAVEYLKKYNTSIVNVVPNVAEIN